MLNDSRLADVEAGTRLFKLLADCFWEPTPELYAELGEFDGLLREYGIVCDTEGIADAATDNHVEVLKEYAKLFVGPFNLLVPPFGSTYLEEDKGLMMGETTVAVKALYLEAGLALSDGFHSPPDHISAELEFYAYLLDRESAAEQAGDESQAAKLREIRCRFLSDHLGVWGPRFAKRLSGQTESAFYAKLGIIAESVLGGEMEKMGAELRA